MDLVERAARLHERALAQSEQSRFDLADRGLRRALDFLSRAEAANERNASVVKVRVLTTLSTVELELHGQAGAGQQSHDLLSQAQLIAQQLRDPAIAFAVENGLALQASRRGDYDEALEHFAAAEQHVADAPVNDALILYLNRGNLHLQRLKLAAARHDLNRCLALAAAVGPDGADNRVRSSSFMARHNLGYLEFLAGNLPLALKLMDQAAAIPTDASLAIAALDKARVLIEAGLSDAANSTLLGAEVEFRRGRLYQELAETRLARAECASLTGNFKAARALAGSARSLFARRGNDRWRRIAELTLLSADQADGRPPTRLIEPATRLAAEFAEQGLDLQSRKAALIACVALCEAGHPDDAQRMLRGLGPIRQTDPIEVKLQQRTVAATLLRHSNQLARARRQVRLGLGALSRHQAQFGSIDLQTADAIHGRALVQLDLDMAAAGGRPHALFDAIERGRAVSRRLTAVTPPADESAELLAELRQLSQIVREIGDDPAAAGEAQALRERIGALYSQLSSISWRAIGDGGILHPAAMHTVAEAAEQQDKVLVSFCASRDHWFAVVLEAGKSQLVRLPGDGARDPAGLTGRIVELVRRCQADLNVLAYGSILEEMRQAVTASLNRSLSALDETLIAPLNLRDRGVVIVPTGRTATLPWNCLPRLRGRSVEVSPTATSWLNSVSAVDNADGIAVEVFSGPGPAGASEEADRVAQVWQPVADRAIANRDAAATRERLADALASATVVHVAAHGSHIRQNPLFSSLQLVDGPLFAYEIADRRVAPHVVLSACELGQATSRPGDETLGLTQVLLQLGAQSVVAGVAQVSDVVAGQVMADYHRRMAAGAESASALAAATESCGYVPFVCFGSSWRVHSG